MAFARTRNKSFRGLRVESLETREVLSTFFVASTGSDTAAGSSTAPWKTLQHAADVVKAGDLVDVRAGTYAGFYLKTSGTATSPITFKAQSSVNITTPTPVSGDGIYLNGASYVVIDGFNIYNATHAGISSRLNNHVTIKNNLADLSTRWGIYTSHSDYVTIDHNTASRSKQEHGIYVANATLSPTVTNNWVYSNAASGIHMNGDLSGGGTGLITNATVTGNVLRDNGRIGGSAINSDGVQNSYYANNLLYNNHSSGISLFQLDAAAGSKNNKVINNTIVGATDARWSLNIQGGSTGNTVYNNILFNNNTARGSINISTDSLPGLVSDYNLVTNVFTPDSASTYLTLAQWRTTTGQDLHSIISTPAQTFLSIANNNYSLLDTSVAIDAGTLTFAPSIDINGNRRPQRLRIDIGAYEHA
jgi:parallel beta-helix repeat protein